MQTDIRTDFYAKWSALRFTPALGIPQPNFSPVRFLLEAGYTFSSKNFFLLLNTLKPGGGKDWEWLFDIACQITKDIAHDIRRYIEPSAFLEYFKFMLQILSSTHDPKKIE